MLRLMLLRHAKSSWEDDRLGDRDRPLAPRGLKAASRMGAFMHESGYAPACVLCSPARRTRQTLDLTLPSIGVLPPVHIEESLYDFGDGSAVLEVIQNLGGTASPLLVIGHNPALAGLAQSLIGEGSPQVRADLVRKFPTGALAVIDFEATGWAHIAPGAGRLIAFVKPKSLDE